jgi:Fe-S cluster biogenesis protein NfuA/nitrite reductase/ring-hydroxylating ferredoxin subunit
VHETVAVDPVARVEGLLADLESLEDPVAREKATEMVQALLDLYGEGLRRVLEHLEPEQAVELAGDELVGHLLLLHDLHPVPVADRVRDALDGVRPYLESHGGDVELVAVEADVVRVALHGSCHGCPSSTMTLKLAIEDAIQRAAPEIERVEAEGTSAPAPAAGPALLQIEVAPAARGDWATVGSLPELRAADTVVKDVAGASLLFAGLDDNLYAYRSSCPGCAGSLDGAALDGGELVCPGCERRFDARRAGRCTDEPQLSLEPVPLLSDDAGIARVALPAPVG